MIDDIAVLLIVGLLLEMRHAIHGLHGRVRALERGGPPRHPYDETTALIPLKEPPP